MIDNCKSFIFKFDLIGVTPQLLIFNNKRYKSLLSAIISFIIIILSISLSLFSLIQYLKYESPIIGYFKDNDEKTNRNFLIKDLILLFELVDAVDGLSFNSINNSIAYYQAYYGIVYNNGTLINNPLNIEKCELGKNIDLSYKDLADEKYTYGRKLEEFYCINYGNENLSLFYSPNFGFSYLTLEIIFKNNSIYKPENLQSLIISENNIIDHYNKSNPIRKSFIYQFTSTYSSLELTKMQYNLQYIKYDSDEGLFFKQSKFLKGISFLDMSFNRNNNNGDYDFNKQLKESNITKIGIIEIQINKSNFDNYKRTYKKLQSLLAEVMRVVSLLFEIGRQISKILSYKNMNKDIYEKLFFNKNQNKRIPYNNNINLKFSKKEEKKVSTERTKSISTDSLEKNNEIKLNNLNDNENNNNLIMEKINNIEDKDIKLKQIKYYHIIKSFFCFKDEKTKLINYCNNLINQDMCIERILERIYNLENINSRFSYEQKNNINMLRTKRYKNKNKSNYKINNLIKRENDDNEVNKKENLIIK